MHVLRWEDKYKAPVEIDRRVLVSARRVRNPLRVPLCCRLARAPWLMNGLFRDHQVARAESLNSLVTRSQMRRNRFAWESSIILEKNEKIVTSWRGNRETAVQKTERQQYGRGIVYTAKEPKNGFLVLTNQRLLFIEKHGVFGKSYHQTLTIPLL